MSKSLKAANKISSSAAESSATNKIFQHDLHDAEAVAETVTHELAFLLKFQKTRDKRPLTYDIAQKITETVCEHYAVG